MNLAIIISGEYREFEIAHKSWPFLKWSNVDFYLSTWSSTQEINERLNINVSEAVNVERVSKYINVSASSIEEQNENHCANEKMIDRWKTGIGLIAANKNYDAVIITRPDLYMNFNEYKFKEFLENLKENTIYAHIGGSNICTNTVQDQIIIGKYQSVRQLLRIDTTWLAKRTNIHWFLAIEFNKIFKHIEHLPFEKFSIIRSNCRGIDISYEVVVKKTKEWYENKYYSEKKVADFKGFSGSKIELIKTIFSKFIRKTGNIERNYEKMVSLTEQGYLVPKIIEKKENKLDMEYIDGLDIATFLLTKDVNVIIEFLSNTLTKFSHNTEPKDYSDIYLKNLAFVDTDENLPFSKDQIFRKLPKILPTSQCHGDFTLENLIYSRENKFVMIDVSSGEYDSWVFDIAKMRQDLECKWFLRNTTYDLAAKLLVIKTALYTKFPIAFDDYLYILMLLRVYKYCVPESREHSLILAEIKRLWK